MKILILTAAVVTLTLFSCTVEKQKIDYGKIHCYHCDMTVVDKSHAAEYVTKKGKAYFFDAAECMIMKLNDDKNEDDMAFVLVSDFNNPGELINAKDASYLVSEAIKSPMGANLSAFNSLEDAKKVATEKGGNVYSWSEIKKQLEN